MVHALANARSQATTTRPCREALRGAETQPRVYPGCVRRACARDLRERGHAIAPAWQGARAAGWVWVDMGHGRSGDARADRCTIELAFVAAISVSTGRPILLA